MVDSRGRRLVEGARSAGAKGRALARDASRLDVRWARCAPARGVREAIISWVLGPMMDWYTRVRVTGREHFRGLKHPVVLVANHSSHLDTPMILRALPRRFRQRTAVAAAADYFYRNRLRAAFFALVFNTVPIARRGGGLGRGTASHLDRLLDQRWNLLLYPEGTRSRTGQVGKLRRGAAVLAAHHNLAVIPIFVKGTREAMPPGQLWPRRRLFQRRYRVEIHFGEPIAPEVVHNTTAATEQIRAFLQQEADATNGDGAPARTPDRLVGVR
jgi:1-acyl-sn-glycerol-3-phosphate acyltransferase